MHIEATWFGGNTFNVGLCSAQGREPFLVVKGCRIVNGSKGEFVSWPSRKMDDGKYWNHCFASEAFSQAVLEAAHKAKPAQDTRTLAERKQRPAEDDVPF